MWSFHNSQNILWLFFCYFDEYLQKWTNVDEIIFFFLINNNWTIFTVVFHFPIFVTESRSTHNDSFCDTENIQHVNYFLQIYLFDPSVWHSNSDLWRGFDDCFCDKMMIYYDHNHNHNHNHDQKMNFKNVVILLTNHFLVDCDDFISEIVQTWLHHFYSLVFLILWQTRINH